ncbi:MAG: hypothetical protein ACRESF_08195 [Pseudomonas sp.]
MIDRIQLLEMLELGPYAARARAVQLTVKQIEVDPDLQVRAEFSEAKAESYADQLCRGSAGPKVIIFKEGKIHRLASGFHRLRSLVLASRKTVGAFVLDGTKRDAIFFATQSNREHDGVERKQPDMRRAVLMMLNDPEWGDRVKWSNQRVADHCGVSDTMVATWRKEVEDLRTRQGENPKKPGFLLSVSDINRLATRRKTKTKVSPREQALAAAAETGRHRPTWMREARAGIVEAVRAYTCLGDTWTRLREVARALLVQHDTRAEEEHEVA